MIKVTVFEKVGRLKEWEITLPRKEAEELYDAKAREKVEVKMELTKDKSYVQV